MVLRGSPQESNEELQVERKETKERRQETELP